MGVPPEEFGQRIARALGDRRDRRLLRTRTVVRPVDATHVDIGGRAFVNFCSNNYLGLSTHPRILAAVASASHAGGFGSGASALVSGYTDAHASAEATLARWKGTEAAVLLPSGYQANHAVVQTLAALGGEGRGGGGVRFLVDKLAHASILDALLGPGHAVRIFPHNGLAKLRRLLAGGDAGTMDVVVTESIFSMDGDAADLEGLVALKREHPFVLVLDEAHGSGVYGPGGAGYARERGLHPAVDVTVVTLSKALGGVGGVVCAGEAFCQAVVNFARAFVYSTSVPPAVAAAAEAAVGVLRDEPHRQRRVRDLALRVRSELRAAGVSLPAGDSPIIPVILGDESTALSAAEALRTAGLLVTAVRPPTVPRGGSRLRVTLSCEHADAEVADLIARVIAVTRGRGRGTPAPPVNLETPLPE